jgi:hypothetical protein
VPEVEGMFGDYLSFKSNTYGVYSPVLQMWHDQAVIYSLGGSGFAIWLTYVSGAAMRVRRELARSWPPELLPHWLFYLNPQQAKLVASHTCDLPDTGQLVVSQFPGVSMGNRAAVYLRSAESSLHFSMRGLLNNESGVGSYHDRLLALSADGTVSVRRPDEFEHGLIRIRDSDSSHRLNSPHQGVSAIPPHVLWGFERPFLPPFKNVSKTCLTIAHGVDELSSLSFRAIDLGTEVITAAVATDGLTAAAIVANEAGDWVDVVIIDL